MRKIINPWIHTEGYNCFGCCPTNTSGLRMQFFVDGKDIISFWYPSSEYQSWLNTLHGGIQAALLDEICGWVIFYQLNTAGVTAKMETRYHKPGLTSLPYIKLRAYLQEFKHNVAVVHGEITDNEKRLLTECSCTYSTIAKQIAESQMNFLPCEEDSVDYNEEDLIKSYGS